MNVLIEFIPIILIFLYVSYTTPFIIISNSILGKILAVTIIVYCTSVDQVYGMLSCILIIWYYELDHVQQLNSLYYDKLYEGLSLIEYTYDNTSSFKIPTKLFPSNTSTSVERLTYPKNVEIPDLMPKGAGSAPAIVENFDADSYFKTFENPKKKTEFTQKYCKHGQLTHLGENVRPEYADHVYPELIFYNKNCNVCDKSCIFSVLDAERLKTEELLTRPHDSNDWFSIVWDKLRSLFPNSNYENMDASVFSNKFW